MKKILYILLLFSVSVQSQFVGVVASSYRGNIYTPDYYVSNSTGSDSNDGLTEQTAWQTLSKVETEITSADAGKVIAFKKGDTWNDLFNLSSVDGTNGNEIVFTSYGSGNKPILKNTTETALTWVSKGSNIYYCTSVTSAPQRLVVDGTERLGGSNMLSTDLGTSVPNLVEWWYGDDGDGGSYLYFYSTTAPTTEVFEYSTSSQSRSLMFIECDYITLHDLDLQGGSTTSVTVYGCDNLTVDDCDIGNLSASGIQFLAYSGTHNSNATIKNNSFLTDFDFDYSTLGTYASAENTGADDGIYVRSLKVGEFYNNTFKNWGHAGVSISPQGVESSGYVAHDIKVYNNTFESTIAYGDRFGMSGNAYNVEVYNNLFDSNKTPVQFNGYNNHFHHNIIKDNVQSPLKLYKQAAFVLQGYGINSHDNIIENNLFIDNEKAGFGIDGYHPSCDVEDNIIRNNIFYNCGTDQSGLTIDLKVDESGDYDAVNNIFQNNIVYNTSETNTINDNGTTRTVATWNSTTTKGNTVENILSSNPDFISTSDYHLQENSPAVNNGNLILASADYEGNTIPYSSTRNDIGIYESEWTTAATTPDPTVTTGIAQLSNFTINDTNKDRVYFDAVGDISTMTTTGFVISNKTITAVDTTNKYFTVSSAFTFWDNNTIRLGENDDTSDSQTALHNFTLSYIENNITEPTASTNRYVSTTGSGDGTSEANAASLTYMAANASAGQTWWIKAGDYGDVTYLTLGNSGTATNPIKYIGYKTTIGDITNNYFDYGVTMSITEMPTISSDATSSNSRGISLTGDYFILRNFQTSEYYRSLFSNDGNSDNFVIDRFNVEDNYDATITGGTGIHFVGSTGMNNARIINSVFINCSMGGITLQGSGYEYNLIDNCKTYNDQTGTTERQDYQITINGSNSIIRNCYSENFNTTSSNGSTHGIGIKGAGYNPNNYNLIEKSTAVNMLEGFYFRNSAIQYSVIKDCISTKTHTGGYTGEVSGGLWLWGGVDYNIIERNIFRNTIYGIALRDNSGEDGTPTPAVGDYNIIRNNIIHDTKFALAGTTNESGSDWNDNTLVNNTFSNCTYIYRNAGSFITISNFDVLNNIFYNVGGLADSNSNLTGWSFNYNVFYNSWTTGIGANDVNVDPQLDSSFQPQATFTSIDVPTLYGVEYDYNDDERDDTTTTIGAIKHDDE